MTKFCAPAVEQSVFGQPPKAPNDLKLTTRMSKKRSNKAAERME